jgi:hypothetical protein
LGLPLRLRAAAPDRMSVVLGAVFLLGATFFVWRANYAEALALHGGQSSPYNQLADAFIHLHLWVVNVPAEALGPGNPYNPAQRSEFLLGYPDYALYGHYLYLTWGPVPVLVLLVPLHLLGFEPTASVVTAPFAITGLGFALATLRVIVRKIGDVSLWMAALAALTLTCASVIPYVVRFPLVYHQEIAGGYCFAMASIWLAASAVIDNRSSLKRLALMSLCVGLAAGSRITLALTAVLLVVVYVSLRGSRPRRGLRLALGVPFGACVLLLLAYNQARFGDPLQYGAIYQINGESTYTAHFGQLSFLPPSLWAYLAAPPRLSALFPFFLINYPQVSYPLSLPAHYLPLSEETGGALAMAPIVIFLATLPWLWRRRPTALGPLAPLLLAMAGVGLACMVFVSYEIYTSTERYEADYMTLLLFGALAAWLALSSGTRGARRRLIQTVGAFLAVWSCVTGMAISYQEINRQPGPWSTLVNLGAPLSTAITAVAGHPVLAEVHTTNQWASPPSYGNLGTEVTGFWLNASDEAEITIVSPDSREDALVANTFAGAALAGTSALPQIRVSGAGQSSQVFALSGSGRQVKIPVHLSRGVNRLLVSPVSSASAQSSPAEAESGAQVLMKIKDLHLASG